MRRSIGVNAAATVLLLCGIAALIAAAGLLEVQFSIHAGQNMRMVRAAALPLLRETIVGIGFIVTSYGTFRLRRWARISVLSLSFGLIGFCAYLGICAHVVFPRYGLPRNVWRTDSALATVLCLFVGLAVTGVWWLVLFTRPSVEAQFAAACVFQSPVSSENTSSLE
jgi:hypothetical protein